MVAAAGDALFANLGLLFAVGVAIGIATALIWQRFHRIRLPPCLAFFDAGLTSFGGWLVGNSVLGAGSSAG
ncbi:hypothetical protein BH10ACT10_BH10ACT10_23210 [soil metagenome]